MTPVEVHDYLRELGTQWTGQGVAMELGCWLGASSVPLLEGLVQVGYDKLFWAFDRWIANKQQVREAREVGVGFCGHVLHARACDERLRNLHVVEEK